ncbi:MAG: hypothetical protein FD124_3724, partial [Alphaproteobacteria bacterium]
MRSSGRTIAMTYDWRVGTSISTRPSRSRNRIAAMAKVGASGTVSSNRLDGMWVNTMVFTSPMRAASQAAPRCDTAFISRAPKNSRPITLAETPKRSKKNHDTSAAPMKPPAMLSMANSAEMRSSTLRL